MNAVTENSRLVMEAPDKIRAAQDLLQTNRIQGLAVLNEIFRYGQPPSPPLDGPYDGELVALENLGFTVPGEGDSGQGLPWGQHLVAAESRGDNILPASIAGCFASVPILSRRDRRWRTSRPQVHDVNQSGTIDTDRQVFNINYDLPLIRH
jgi:hypothetical protein